MSALEFGRDRLPPAAAESAPAWPPLVDGPVISKVTVTEPGISQIAGTDGIWHRYTGPSWKAVYRTRCGLTIEVSEVRSRTTDAPTCLDCVE